MCVLQYESWHSTGFVEQNSDGWTIITRVSTNLEDDDEAEASSGHLVIKQGVVAGRIIAEALWTEDIVAYKCASSVR